jgi:MFS family permease
MATTSKGAGNLLFLLAFVFVTMNLVWGPADRVFQSYKRPVLIGAVATTALLAWLAIVGRPASPTLITWFVLLGVAASFTPVLTAHGRALFPHELVGRGLTLMNLGTMLGVFVMQALTGVVVGRFAAPGGVYPLDAYRAAFAVEAVLLGVATLVYLRARDPLRPNKI